MNVRSNCLIYEGVTTITAFTKQVTECRINHGIEVKGDGCPPPIQSFAELHLPPHSLAELQRLGYEASAIHV